MDKKRKARLEKRKGERKEDLEKEEENVWGRPKENTKERQRVPER